MERSELAGREVVLRRATLADAPALAAILAEPGVARWWGTFDLERVTADLMGADPEEHAFTIEHDGEIVGYIQAVEEEEPDFRSAGIDLFLRTDAQGRGLGPDAIRAVAAYLIDDRGHHRLTIDPAAENARAIAAYAKLGFRPVGRMRQYQRMADGGWVDALLMDLLAAELVR
jgi:aminoglycoside 6'-N-acetyltransferase